MENVCYFAKRVCCGLYVLICVIVVESCFRWPASDVHQFETTQATQCVIPGPLRYVCIFVSVCVSVYVCV